MKTVRKAGHTTGCLMIEDFSSERGRVSGLYDYLNAQGVQTEIFDWNGEGCVHTRLQNAFYSVRKNCERTGIVAVDGGIDGAIALSAQLPVEGMVLICTGEDVARAEGGDMRRQFRRLSRFARRNMTFCVSDVLLISEKTGTGQDRADRIAKMLVNCASIGRLLHAKNNDKIWTDYEWAMNNQIYRFLFGEEFTKSLAENSEMCIIYG